MQKMFLLDQIVDLGGVPEGREAGWGHLFGIWSKIYSSESKMWFYTDFQRP